MTGVSPKTLGPDASTGPLSRKDHILVSTLSCGRPTSQIFSQSRQLVDLPAFPDTETFRLILIKIIIKQSGNHVMRRSDSMKVSGEMKINLFHREHLGISSSGRTAFHTETGSERGFT